MQGMVQGAASVSSVLLGQGVPLPLEGARMLRVRVVVPAPHPAPPPAPGAGRGSVQFPHALQGAREQGTSGAGGQEAAAQGASSSRRPVQVPMPLAGFSTLLWRTRSPPPQEALQASQGPQGPSTQSVLGMVGSYTR